MFLARLVVSPRDVVCFCGNRDVSRRLGAEFPDQGDSLIDREQDAAPLGAALANSDELD